MTVIDARVDDIQFIEDLYPRGGFDQETVNRYRQAIDNLPPIEITHENILIDGYHRLIAHRIEQRKAIKAEVEQLDRADVLWEATRRNAKHGLQLSLTDKKKLARKFFDDEKNRTQADIANALSVDASSISRWVQDLKQSQDEERDAKIWQMWLACCSLKEIGDAFGISGGRVSQMLDDFRKLHLQEIKAPDSLQTFNLWNFQNNDDRYGIEGYPGRIPGQIIENVLHYYTKPFDTVVDPMAGGGTTIDVCKAMGRRWRAYDINPVRDDIKRHDIIAGFPVMTSGFPAEAKGCNLIFLDPPYWKQKQGDYSGDETNLANLQLEEFNHAMQQIFQSALDVLAPGGVLAVIVGLTQSKGTIYDHAVKFSYILERVGFEFSNRVIVPYTTQQAQPYHVTDARNGRYMLKLYRDLLIYRKAG